MARHEHQQTRNKEFGEAKEYDPTFKGPLYKRSCTDILCLLLFLFFIGGWIAVGVFAFKYGDPVKLSIPADTEGRMCGFDDEVRSKPYLFFFDLAKCARSDVLIHGCPTPQICVKECPTEHFAFAAYDKADWQSKMICKDDVPVSTLSRDKAKEMINDNKCAAYYLQSTPVYGRCIPTLIDPESKSLQELLNKTKEALQELVAGQRSINVLIEAKQIGEKIVQDLSNSWPYIVGALVVAMLLCFVYIVLMRWFAGIMVWLSLFSVVALLSYCCYMSYVRYDELNRAGVGSDGEALRSQSHNAIVNFAEQELDQLLHMKVTWLIFVIISAVALGIVLLMLIFLRKRIQVAVALIREASKAVGSIMSTLVFPLIPWLLQLLVIGWFVLVMLYLASSTHPVYKAAMDGCTCHTPNVTYVAGDRCDPETFHVCSASCPNAVCHFYGSEKEEYVNYLQAYNTFGIFWMLCFVSAVGEMILAATFATWYWTFNKSDVPFFTITNSMLRICRYHLGTAAFGSLILALCRIIRVMLEFLNRKLKKYDNRLVRIIMCCLRCFFWCLENFIKFINRNAYIMCAIYGKNFCRSAKEAFSLLMRNIVRVYVLDTVTDFLLFLGKLAITAGICALSFHIFTHELEYKDYVNIPSLNYSIVPVLIIGFGTYFIASVFFEVYSMAVDTLFLCFLEDCERNDGSAEKPYFMSRNLMKILHKKNK